MPWCPKCKAEYQEGFTECTDCGILLVDSLEEEVEFIPFFQTEEKKVADKLGSYFEYSGLKAVISYDEENEYYIVSVPPREQNKAKKLYQAFIFVEKENLVKDMIKEELQTQMPADDEEGKENAVSNDSPEPASEVEEEPDIELYDEAPEAVVKKSFLEEEDEIPDVDFDGTEPIDDASAYVMKADRYKDLAGTVWTFMIFGIVGLVFVLLNMAGILTILNGWIPNMVMLLLFISFLYVAISTNGKARKIKTEIDDENKLTKQINDWLQINFTKEFLKENHHDDISEELNYIKVTDAIKERLVQEFGTQNPAYLDRMIEDYYNETFD